MKLYLIVEVVAESGEERVKNGAKFLRSIDGKWHGTSEQSEGREHADKPEAVVAVYVTDEYRHHLVESHSRAAHLSLRTLAAIYHKLLLTYLHHLRRRIVTQCGQGAAASKDMNFKWFHKIYYF